MKKIYAVLLGFALMAANGVALGQEPAASVPDLACFFKDARGSLRPLQIDQHHLHVSLDLDTNERAVAGVATLFFSSLQSGLDSLFLDAPNMRILSVALDAAPVKFVVAANGVGVFLPHLQPGPQHMLQVKYHTIPQKGLYFLGWNGPSRARRQIWSQGQGIDNRHWIPHVDAQNDKLTTSIELVFDSQYQVISNGKMIQQSALPDGRTRWHFAMDKPHSSYLMALAIGKYGVEVQHSKSRVPILNYYYPDRYADVSWTYRQTVEIFDWLEQETGVPYPWAAYAQAPVKDFLFGGMENTAATLFNDMYHVDSFQFGGLGYFRVNLHELAHQWFGNLMTAYGGTDHWLHEGFATLYEYLGEEALFDTLTGTVERLDALGKVLENVASLPIAHADAGSLNHYQKAALVLYQLRAAIGAADFKRATQQFLQRFEYQNATSKDFELALHRATGRVYETYFNQWVHQPIVPDLEVHYALSTSGKGKSKKQVLKAFIAQTTTNTQPFEMVVELAAGVKGAQTFRTKKTITQLHDTIVLDLPAKGAVTWYGIDPNRVLLANIVQNFTPQQQVAFFENAPSYAYKWQLLRDVFLNDAATPDLEMVHQLLKSNPHPRLQKFLFEMLQVLNAPEDPTAMATNPLPDWAVAFAQKNLNEPIASALLLAGWMPANVAERLLLLQMLDLKSMEVREAALFTLLFSQDDSLPQIVKETQPFSYRPYGTFPVTWHFLNLVIGQSESFPFFLDFVTENHDIDQRKHAFELMGMAQVVNPFLIDQAYQATKYFNPQLRTTAKEYLQVVYQLAPANLEEFLKSQGFEGVALQAAYQDLGLPYNP